MQKKLKATWPVKPQSTELLTLEQVRVLLTAVEGEMQTLILLGVRTGQSFRDLLALKWRDVDIAKGVIRFRQVMTRRALVVPMTTELRGHLNQLAKAGPDALVLPWLGRSNMTAVDQQFRKLVEQVGLRGTRWRALRVTFVCQLWDVGITQEVAMPILGFKDIAAASKYSPPNIEELRAAIDRLPPLK
jgi:integrase